VDAAGREGAAGPASASSGRRLIPPRALFWSRQKFKGIAALKRKINPTRAPIERKKRA
jgi:hypothetical protein